jgi:hypothetical protein
VIWPNQTPLTKKNYKPATCFIACFFSCIGLHSQSAVALEFPIMLKSDTSDLHINVDTGQAGQQALVYLDNQEAVSASCKIIFTNGPELPIERRVTLTANSKQIVKATLKRDVVKLKVDVTCANAEESTNTAN